MEDSRLEISDDEIRTHLRAAVRTTLHDDKDLLLLQAQEQSIAHRIAVYLEPCFKGYHVDCEYNRFQDQIKRYYSTERKRNAGFRPDIIVHIRNQKINLLAVEIKANGTADDDRDQEKLIAMVEGDNYHYQVAAYVRIHNADDDMRNEPFKASFTWYSRSKPEVIHELLE